LRIQGPFSGGLSDLVDDVRLGLDFFESFLDSHSAPFSEGFGVIFAFEFSG
jgi:hypothetical protein